MILDVSATRMELMRLRKRHSVAVRGHSMLKDKLDELIKQFLDLVEENQGRRKTIEEHIIEAVDYFIMAKASVHEAVLKQAIQYNEGKASLLKEEKRILNLVVPVFNVETEGDIHSYGFSDTAIPLDASLSLLQKVLPEMVKLAELEKNIQILAEEIETTRRRVNALEYVLIPNLEETIRYIRMTLDERERSALTRLMKVKEIIQAK
jgi:V/A-type H+-transporting ATPase subunit D